MPSYLNPGSPMLVLERSSRPRLASSSCRLPSRPHRSFRVWRKRLDPKTSLETTLKIPTLIYCADGTQNFHDMAVGAGWLYGCKLPRSKIYGPLYMADQDWKKPNRASYMKSLSKHRPTIATVVDWESLDQLSEVLDWADEASQYVERIIIIPKVLGGIPKIPLHINGKEIILGYSVPTRYGGTKLTIFEFAKRSVHLLGGSPNKQINTFYHMRGFADVVSLDCNMMVRMANVNCSYWERGKWWTIRSMDGTRFDGHGPNEAFRRSITNIMNYWKDIENQKF